MEIREEEEEEKCFMIATEEKLGQQHTGNEIKCCALKVLTCRGWRIMRVVPSNRQKWSAIKTNECSAFINSASSSSFDYIQSL